MKVATQSRNNVATHEVHADCADEGLSEGIVLRHSGAAGWRSECELRLHGALGVRERRHTGQSDCVPRSAAAGMICPRPSRRSAPA
jgi:hypothetical protein